MKALTDADHEFGASRHDRPASEAPGLVCARPHPSGASAHEPVLPPTPTGVACVGYHPSGASAHDSGLLARLPLARARARQLLRYGTVSLISTATSLVVLGVLVATRTVTPGWANVVATAVGTVPSFELNRRWVWGRTDARRLVAQAGPFCALSFSGLALSTLTVSLAGRWATHAAMSGTMRTAVVELANVAAFGTLWVAQFVILDRLLFGRTRAPALEQG